MAITVKLSSTAQSIASQIEKKAAEYAKKRYVMVGINDRDGVKRYGDGPTNLATVAQYLEYGWVQVTTRNQQRYFFGPKGIGMPVGSVLFMPPRPFLRATLRHRATDWAQVFGNAMQANQGDLELALAMVGIQAKDDIQQTIIDAGIDGEEFPRRSPLTQALYEIYNEGHKTDGTGNLMGDKPLVRSGLLLDSIHFNVV